MFRYPPTEEQEKIKNMINQRISERIQLDNNQYNEDIILESENQSAGIRRKASSQYQEPLSEENNIPPIM
jgi:hypothetical protein